MNELIIITDRIASDIHVVLEACARFQDQLSNAELKALISLARVAVDHEQKDNNEPTIIN